MGFLESIFNFISSLFTKLFEFLKKILPYILLGCAIWLALGGTIGLGWLVSGMSILPSTANALLLAGSSFLLAPTETGALISNAVHAVGEAATDVISTVADVAGSALSSVVSQPVVLIALALGAWYLLSRDKKEEPPSEVTEQLKVDSVAQKSPEETPRPFLTFGAQNA